MAPTVRTVAVAVFFGMFFLEFLSYARSLQCYQCSGASREPTDEPSCTNQIQNCTGAKNTCMTQLTKDNSSGKTKTFVLECKAEVDCERGIGCMGEAQTICTYCCKTDRCNKATVAPTTESGSRQLQPFANILLLVSLAALYFVKDA